MMELHNMLQNQVPTCIELLHGKFTWYEGPQPFYINCFRRLDEFMDVIKSVTNDIKRKCSSDMGLDETLYRVVNDLINALSKTH